MNLECHGEEEGLTRAANPKGIIELLTDQLRRREVERVALIKLSNFASRDLRSDEQPLEVLA